MHTQYTIQTTILIPSPLTTLGQETSWAYSTASKEPICLHADTHKTNRLLLEGSCCSTHISYICIN